MSIINLFSKMKQTAGWLVLLLVFLNYSSAGMVGAVSVMINSKPICQLAVVWQTNKITLETCRAGEDKNEAQQRFASLAGVVKVGEVQSYHLSLVPNDPGFGYQSPYLEKIKLPQALDRHDVLVLKPVIAILDSGVDINNPDLKPNLWFNAWEVPGDRIDNDHNGYVDDQYGYDFTNNTGDPMPKFEDGWTEVAMNHGTVVAGVAAAVTDNNIGIAGISSSVKIMPLRVLNSKGVGNTVAVARAIDYAIANGADIINLSFVGPHSDPILEDAISRAYKAGVLVVAASGNEQGAGVNMNNTPQYPVCDDSLTGDNQVIGVAAVDLNDKLADFSNFGSRCVDIAAPGVKIFSTQFQKVGDVKFKEAYGGYWSGTSVAAPLVSGTLALLKAAYPHFSPSQLRDIVIASGDEIDYLNPAFKGLVGRRLNIKAAFELADKTKSTKKNSLVLTPYSNNKSQVQIYNSSGEPINSFLAYNPNFLSGVNVAAGDVNGDGQMEIVTAPRAGGGPHIKIFNQRGVVLGEFMAFMELFRGGVSLTTGDVNGDKKSEIIVATGKGAVATVRIFDGTGKLLYQFLPYDEKYTGGLNITAGDIDNNQRAEIIVAPQMASKLPVRVLDRNGRKIMDIKGIVAGKGGIQLAAGDLNSDNKTEIIISNGNGGNSLLRILNQEGKITNQFWAYAKNFYGGVNATVGDTDGDGINEIITVPGPISGPHLRIFDGQGKVKSEFFTGSKTFRGGLNVAVFK